jgi:hypothetical protein
MKKAITFVLLAFIANFAIGQTLADTTKLRVFDPVKSFHISVSQLETHFAAGTLSKADDTNVTLTLGGTPANSLFNSVSITAGWTGSLAATRGGTGQTTYAVGDILYASTTSALSRLADVATGNVLLSGGVSTAPLYGKVGLTTHISGTLPIANGGTNLTAIGTAKQVLRVNAGASALEYSSTVSASGGVAAGTTSDPDASAILEANSTTKGFLLPRLTTAQRDAVSSPVAGLEVYNTETGGTDVYNGTRWTRNDETKATPGFTIGSGWGTGSSSSIEGNDLSGKITINSGTGAITATTIGTIVFNKAFPSGSKYSVRVWGADSDAAGANMSGYAISTTQSTTGYVIDINNTNITLRLSTSTGYEVFYQVVQYE